MEIGFCFIIRGNISGKHACIAKMNFVSICACMQPLVKKDKERELKKKTAELQSKVESLEKKCAVLEVNKCFSSNDFVL